MICFLFSTKKTAFAIFHTWDRIHIGVSEPMEHHYFWLNNDIFVCVLQIEDFRALRSFLCADHRQGGASLIKFKRFFFQGKPFLLFLNKYQPKKKSWPYSCITSALEQTDHLTKRSEALLFHNSTFSKKVVLQKQRWKWNHCLFFILTLLIKCFKFLRH